MAPINKAGAGVVTTTLPKNTEINPKKAQLRSALTAADPKDPRGIEKAIDGWLNSFGALDKGKADQIYDIAQSTFGVNWKDSGLSPEQRKTADELLVKVNHHVSGFQTDTVAKSQGHWAGAGAATAGWSAKIQSHVAPLDSNKDGKLNIPESVKGFKDLGVNAIPLVPVAAEAIGALAPFGLATSGKPTEVDISKLHERQIPGLGGTVASDLVSKRHTVFFGKDGSVDQKTFDALWSKYAGSDGKLSHDEMNKMVGLNTLIKKQIDGENPKATAEQVNKRTLEILGDPKQLNKIETALKTMADPVAKFALASSLAEWRALDSVIGKPGPGGEVSMSKQDVMRFLDGSLVAELANKRGVEHKNMGASPQVMSAAVREGGALAGPVAAATDGANKAMGSEPNPAASAMSGAKQIACPAGH
jgi:hypothetical protein